MSPNREEVPMVIAEHFLPGYKGETTCPLTGQKKSKGSVVCRLAFNENGGSKATQTLESIMMQLQFAKTNQTPGEKPPETIFAVLAQIKVNKNARHFKDATADDDRLWSFRGLPEGGKIHVTFFGCEDDKGKEITAIILLKKKAVDFRPYLTVWKVEGVKSNAVFTLNEEKIDDVLPSLPLAWCKGEAQMLGKVGFYRQ